MGQGQSAPQATATAAPEPVISEEERAQAQAEMRAKQQEALDKRLAAQNRKPKATASAQATKKPTALQEMSKENLGWRNADENADLRRWN